MARGIAWLGTAALWCATVGSVLLSLAALASVCFLVEDVVWHERAVSRFRVVKNAEDIASTCMIVRYSQCLFQSSQVEDPLCPYAFEASDCLAIRCTLNAM